MLLFNKADTPVYGISAVISIFQTAFGGCAYKRPLLPAVLGRRFRYLRRQAAACAFIQKEKRLFLKHPCFFTRFGNIFSEFSSAEYCAAEEPVLLMWRKACRAEDNRTPVRHVRASMSSPPASACSLMPAAALRTPPQTWHELLPRGYPSLPKPVAAILSL